MSTDFQRDERFMRFALEEAARAMGQTSPNPMVGCVIVRDDEIIARGFHEEAGREHAEVVALTNAGELAEGAELYVNLEPCSHFGRTPPCVDAIKQSGIRRVVASMIDPDPRVSGRGMRLLAEAGIETKVGVCEAEARRLNEGFISRITRKRPFITVKLAMSLDGKIATRTGDSQWISGEDAREYVHQLRSRTNVITVGPGTAAADNPRLTARPGGTMAVLQPSRFVVEGSSRIQPGSHVFNTEEAATTVFVDKSIEAERLSALESTGVRVLPVGTDGRVPVETIVERAYEDGASTMLVEGGGGYVGAFFDADLVDRLILFIAPLVIGGADAIAAIGGTGAELVQDAWKAANVRAGRVGEDLFIEANFTES